VGSTHRGAFAE
jgi:hypothetical protein